MGNTKTFDINKKGKFKFVLFSFIMLFPYTKVFTIRCVKLCWMKTKILIAFWQSFALSSGNATLMEGKKQGANFCSPYWRFQ